MANFRLLIEQLRVEARNLQTLQREVNPLLSKRTNPVKDVPRSTQKARKTQAAPDIRAARSAHDRALTYARQHGLPRLSDQLAKHKKSLPKAIRPTKKKQTSKRSP